MNSFAVPEVIDPNVEDITALTDFLIGGLLRASPGVLHAKLGESLPKVVWYLTTKNGSAPFYEMKGILFRSVLARIGFHYLGGKMYGGISSILLTQQRNFFQALFEMSNSGQSGFWIKITTAQKSD